MKANDFPFGAAEFADKDLLFIRGNCSVRTIPEMLGGMDRINELEVYHTIDASPDDVLKDKVKAGLKTNEIDWVCFFSPSGVVSFTAQFGGEEIRMLKTSTIGETIARRA